MENMQLNLFPLPEGMLRKTKIKVQNKKAEKPKPRIYGPFDEFISVSAVARFLRVSRKTITNHRSRINYFQHGPKLIQFIERDIVSFVNRNYFPRQIFDDEFNKIIDNYKVTLKDSLLTPSDVCQELHIKNNTLGVFREKRKISFIKITNSIYRYTKRDLQDFIDGNYHQKLSYL